MNALFKQIYDAVVQGRTNRPALVAETRTAIKEATMELHSAAKFFADLRSTNVVLSSGEATRVKFIFTPFRRSVYRVTAIDKQNNETPLHQSTLAHSNRWATNWFRVLGHEFEIQTSQPANAFRVEFFAYPDLSDTGYDSWIAKQYPFAVADLAAAKVFALVEPQLATLYFTRVGNPAIVSSHLGRIVQENQHAAD